MKQGNLVGDFQVPPHPKGISIDGRMVTLKPLIASQFAEELFLSNSIDKDGTNWAYLPYGPFEICLLYTSPSPRDQRGSRLPSSA